MSWQERYYGRFYDRSRGFKDGTTEFHELCAEKLDGAAKILEIGSGPSNPTTRFLATIAEVHGLDPDPDVRDNDALSSASVLEGGRFPYDDDSFDGAVSDFVVEHVDDPRGHLEEIARVLKPGAAYIFRTPNRFHYVALISSMTPHWFHVKVANRVRNLPSEAHDPYPTVYRMNSRRSLRRHSEAAGLVAETLRMIEKDPSYGRATRWLFFPFMFYERIVNSTELLQDVRANILGTLRLPARSGD